ncbi:MAG: hypothetical protein A2V83_10735 [Nitrospirae bacterium RBG_16_64_22]|nr:MAG: hypothetical protein A2V83_10735 [Nitrospirae bacterium RBG_16_64_22]
MADKREEVARRLAQRPLADLRARIADVPLPRPFGAALARKGGDPIRLIAEVKRASPSAGTIREDVDPAGVARIYREAGARAVSVLTDKPHFGGSLDDLRAVRGAVDLPLLRKDFVFDPYQVYEAREAGADAVLLIAAVLSRGQIEDLAGVTKDLGLDALVEVHTPRELDQVLLAGGLLVGINNRDLATFETRLQTTFDLLADCPEEAVVVSESGIKTREDVARLEEAGVDAVLVGETFMRAADIGGKVRELLGE